MNAVHSPSNDTFRLKREILVRLIKAFFSDNFEKNARLIPFDMRPKGCEVPYRCCVYKERAAIQNRIIAGLGISLENDTERTLISEYAHEALKRERPDNDVLTVLESACKGCSPNAVYVTDLCQGCVSRPCINTCKFSAINISDGRSHIDPQKCRQCGMCIKVCPYQAITKRIVPCENVCPVGAIAKSPSGHARIDFERCISCGKCTAACPFGAVHEKSQIIDVLVKMKQGRRVIAMAAPAYAGQFPCTPEQFNTALKMAGFSDVYEVAFGADITAQTEAGDFLERMEKGAAFMTTSCCGAYNELVKKNLPEIKPFVSDTKTPLYYTAEIVKKENPGDITVFLSPCVSKRKEAADNVNIDYVLSFEETGALFIALGIEVAECAESRFSKHASKQGRSFPITGGVAESVRAAAGDRADILKPVLIDGIDRQTVKLLKKYAKDGKCPDGNLLEVMSCPGGCIAGSSAVNSVRAACSGVKAYACKGEDIKPLDK